MSYAYILTSEGLTEKIKLIKFLIFKCIIMKNRKKIKFKQELNGGNEFYSIR